MKVIFKIFFILIISFNIYSQDTKTYKIVSIEINGNKITKKQIIEKELNFGIGDKYYSIETFNLKVEQSKSNLLNTGLFNFVDISYKTVSDTNLYVKIKLTEQWYIWPIPFVEHADRNFSSFLHNKDWSRINYGLFLQIDNFRGRREQLKFKIRGGYKQQYGFMYSKPNLDKEQKHGISFESSYFRQHEIAYKTENNQLVYYLNPDKFTQTLIRSTFIYSYRQTLYDFYDITVQFNRNDVIDTIVKLNPEYLANNKSELNYFNLSFNYRKEHRNYIYYPTKGFVFNINYTAHLFLSDINNINTFTAEYRWYKPIISNSLFWGQSFYGKLSDDTKQPYFLINGFGYSHYLRAYEYYVIDGYNALLIKNNIRFNVLKRKEFKIPFIPWSQFNKSFLSIYLNTFFETGYVENSHKYNHSNTMVNSWLYSYGIGIDFVTYYETVLRLEYSINGLGEAGFFIHMGSGI